MKTVRKSLIKKPKLIVIKIGSRVISDSKKKGLNSSVISNIANQISQIKENNVNVIIVSSGAVAAGIKELNLESIPDNIPQKQAAAAIGQSHLIGLFERAFKKHNIKVAQLLLTHDDLGNRKRYLNARNTISIILNYNIIPIINENDTVAVDEIKFGDNDTLSAMVASLADADLLIILSDVDGLFTSDPVKNADSELIGVIGEITPEIERLAGGSVSSTGVGGMVTKIKSAKIASASGIPTVIVNGSEENILLKVLGGDNIGTIFKPDKTKLKSRKHWIAYTLKSSGQIHVDSGAKIALIGKGKSLLPSGIISISENFKMGDSLSCIDENGKEFARGLTNYSAKDLKKIIGKQTEEIKNILGDKCYDEVIHRDNLVLL